MEKRRRARINNCLNDLKTLILDAMKKDVSIFIYYKKKKNSFDRHRVFIHFENLQSNRSLPPTILKTTVLPNFFKLYNFSTPNLSK